MPPLPFPPCMPFIAQGSHTGMDRLAAGMAAAVGAILVLVVSASVASSGDPASAQIGAQRIEKTASATGVASSSVPPDLFVAVFGVEVEAETARRALSDNSEMMAAVIESLRGAGVGDDDISTSDLNIRPQYSYDDETDTSSVSGYRVSNTVRVETALLDSATEIIDSGVAAGANRVDYVSFDLSPGVRSAVSDALIKDAVLDAQKRAELAIEPLGQRIVGVKSVSVMDVRATPWDHLVLAREGAADSFGQLSAAAPTPVFASDAVVSVQAQVVFLIADGGGR